MPIVINKKNDTYQKNLKKLKKCTLRDFEIIEKKENRNSHIKNSVAAIVNSTKNGKRFEIKKEIVLEITNGDSPTIAIALNKSGIALIPSTDKFDVLKMSGNKFVRYSTDLVNAITSNFNLDFTKRVCISFFDVEFMNCDGIKIAFIPVERFLDEDLEIEEIEELEEIEEVEEVEEVEEIEEEEIEEVEEVEEIEEVEEVEEIEEIEEVEEVRRRNRRSGRSGRNRRSGRSGRS
jgi:hypothetical protein